LSASDVGIFQGASELRIANGKLVVGIGHVGRVKRLKEVRQCVAGQNVTNIQCEKEVQHHLANLPPSENTTGSRFFKACFAVKLRSMDPLARDKDVTPWQPVTRQFNKNPNALGQAAQQR
jgi:hypothetical protein